MRTKQISFTFALALGMLVMFMLPMVAWEGVGDTAHAQGPDVGSAAVPQMTVGISQTTFEVASTGVSTIYLESTEGITVTNILFKLELPDDIVQLQGRPYALPITSPALAVTTTGNIVDYSQTGNQISFQWDFPISSGLPITPNNGRVAIVALPWSGTQVGDGNVSIQSADIDTFGTSFHGQPGATLDGIINVIRRQTYLRLDGPTCGTQNLLLNQTSTGVTNTVVSLTADWITGANFQLVYDSNILEVVNANVIGGMNGSADTSVDGIIRFSGITNNPTDFNNQQILEITWRGLEVGSTTPSLRNAVLLDENGNNLAIPALQFGDRTNGVIGPICDTIAVQPLPRQLWFEAGSFDPVALSCGTTQDIRIQGVDNLNRVEVHVNFDPNQLQVIDQDLTEDGIQIEVGDAFSSNPPNYVKNANIANNNTGRIDFALTLNTGEFINSGGSPENLAAIHWNRLPGATTGAAANITFSAVAFQSLESGNRVVQVPVTSFDSTMSTIGAGNCGTITPDTYSIAGTVKDNSGAALANVTVSAGGANTATTDSSGTYTITNLADGSYTVTPSLSGYTFTPANRNVPVSGANTANIDFTGTRVITPPQDGLTVSPTSLTFNGTIGQPDPAAQTINITTSGSWTASASVTSGGNWLTVDPTSGSGNGTVNVRTNLSGLAVGTYNGTVTITAGSNSETVNVTLNVTTDGGGGGDGAISGQIRALGRTTNGQPDHSGIRIYLSDLTCDDFNVTNATPNFTTSADGRFNITVNSTVRCLRVFRDGHLSGQRTNPSGNLGLLELPGGDIIRDDDTIDIFDLARAGNQYQQPNPDPLVDFDSDGDVDIFDLGIIATNFGQSGPVDDWR